MPPRTPVADLIDTALDRSIALGYGHPGLAVRRRLPGWPANPPRMDGKLVLITGAASGIGLAAARGFAELGATVAAVARSEERAHDVVREVRAAVPAADVRPWACDVSSIAELRRLAAGYAQAESRLDVLVNNAGVMPDERQRSVEGHELMFATHVLAPFALTALLREMLERSAPARVINVSSGGMYGQGLPGEDVESDQAGYGPKKLYARTKREQVVITEQWADRLRGNRRGGALDAPRLGRHQGRARLDAVVPTAHHADHPHARAGRRHDRLARWCGRAAAQHRAVLARPASAPHALPARRRRGAARGSPAALGGVRVGARRRLSPRAAGCTARAQAPAGSTAVTAAAGAARRPATGRRGFDRTSWTSQIRRSAKPASQYARYRVQRRRKRSS